MEEGMCVGRRGNFHVAGLVEMFLDHFRFNS